MAKKGNEDFKKTKSKVGQKRRSENETTVSFKAKRLVIRQDTENMGSVNVQKATQSDLSDLLGQLKHYSSSVRKDSVWKLKEMLSNNPEMMETALGPILSLFTPLIIDEDPLVRQAFTKVYPSVLASIGEDDIMPFKDTVSIYINHGLTSINKGIKKTTILLLDELFKMSYIQLLCSPVLLNNLITVAQGNKNDSIRLNQSSKPMSNNISTNNNSNNNLEEMTMKLLNTILNTLNNQNTIKSKSLNYKPLDTQLVDNIIPLYSLSNLQTFISDINKNNICLSSSIDVNDQLIQSVYTLLQYISTLLIQYSPSQQSNTNGSFFNRSSTASKSVVTLDSNDLIHVQLYMTLAISCIKYINKNTPKDNDIYTPTFINSFIRCLNSSFPYKLADKVRNEKQNKIDVYLINSTTLYLLSLFISKQKHVDAESLYTEVHTLLCSDIYKQEITTKIFVSYKFIITVIKSLHIFLSEEQINNLISQLYHCLLISNYNEMLLNTYIEFCNYIMNSITSISTHFYTSLFPSIQSILLNLSQKHNYSSSIHSTLLILITNMIRRIPDSITNEYIDQINSIYFTSECNTVTNQTDNHIYFQQLPLEIQQKILNLLYFLNKEDEKSIELIQTYKNYISNSLLMQYSNIINSFNL